MQVKMPVTRAGVEAIEESTYHGVNVNATVSFTVPQAVAVAEAVERGLNRRAAEGKDNGHMRPVCTIMIGRTDDWMKMAVKRVKSTSTRPTWTGQASPSSSTPTASGRSGAIACGCWLRPIATWATGRS
jgi:transaldolase